MSNNPNTTIVCTAFSLTFSDRSVSTELSPFGSDTSYSGPPNAPISDGGLLFTANITNAGTTSANATWNCAGSVTTRVGTNTPRALSFDPEIEAGPID